MTLEEWERQVLVDIAAIKLKNCVAELELEQERLLQKRQRGYTMSSSRRGVSTLGPVESWGWKDAAMTVGRTVEETEDGFALSDERTEFSRAAAGIHSEHGLVDEHYKYSTYGTARQSCPRSRSRSDSQSSSSSRRRRSKRNLRKFTISWKNLHRLNPYELIGTLIRWFLSIDGLNMNDERDFLENIKFISIRAMHDDFRDSPHVEYDIAIRRQAETLGFKAFS